MVGIYGVVCLFPTLLTGFVYWSQGLFDVWWYCNFGFVGAYMELRKPLADMLRLVQGNLLQFWPLLLLSVFGLAMARRAPRDVRIFLGAVLAWALVEVAVVVAPQKFFDHYFLVLLPPLSLLSGFALVAVAQRAVIPELREIAAPAMAVCVALVPLADLVGKLSPGWMNLGKPDVPRQVAAVIRSDPQPEPTAWVVNSEPVIYFLAGIPIPTRFPFPPHVVGGQSGFTRNDPSTEVTRILRTHPRYLVVDEGRWGEVRASLQATIRDTLTRDYALAVSIPSKPANVNLFRLKSAVPPPAATDH
jgi:hypothetical protein